MQDVTRECPITMGERIHEASVLPEPLLAADGWVHGGSRRHQ